MKILFIITQSEIGGAQRFLLEFAPYLAKRGHAISLIAGQGDGELFAELESRIMNHELKIYHISHLVRSLNPLKDVRALISIIQIIRKEKPDALFLQSTKAGFLGSLSAKVSRIHNSKFIIPVIYRIGGWAFNDPRPRWMNQIVFWMEKVSSRWKDIIIVNSEYDQRLAIDKRIAPPEKIVKIYNGVDPEKLNFLMREEAREKITKHKTQITNKTQNTNYKQQKVIVGTIANLYATKGIEYLIEAAHILYQLPVTSYQFIVIGEGPERAKLEALIKKYHLENNFFLIGRLPNATQYLKAFDIFILPSIKEGFPWVLLEAMAAEVPIIATRVGAVPEVIEDGKDGLLVPPRHSQALAKKIQQLLTPETLHILHDREVYVKNAKDKLKQFASTKMLQESEGVLNLHYARHTTARRA